MEPAENLRRDRKLSILMKALVVSVLCIGSLGQVCAPANQPPANTAPTANAGTDQTVTVGSAVTLNGSATDPDAGDVLSFAWTQSAGTTVTLANAATATPSFVAPNTAGALSFQLSVSDGNGGTDTDSVTVLVTDNQPPPPPPVTPTLYIASFNGNNVVAYDISNPNNINGNIAPDANLQGAQTLLNQPSDIIIDAGGALLASNFNTPSITGYDNAADLSGINGNVAPSRNVQGAATLLNQPTSLAVRTSSDLVFVANIGTDQIQVFANASSNALNGNLAPTRTIQSVDLNNPFGINFGSNDNLYVANNGNNNVLVFANASNLNGAVAATRILTSAAFVNVFDVFIDANDRLYVVNGNGQILTFNNASTRNGAVTPDFTLTIQGAVATTAIAVDSSNTGYIVDNAANAVYSYNNIATRNGAIAPDRTLQGANTLLVGPIRVFLLE